MINSTFCGCDLTDLTNKYGTPLYLIDLDRVVNNYSKIMHSITYEPFTLYYAMMCNDALQILRLLHHCGVSLQVSTIRELEAGNKAGFCCKRISMTSTNLSVEDLRRLKSMAFDRKAPGYVNLDSLEELEKFGTARVGSEVGIRVFVEQQIAEHSGTNRPIASKQRVGVKREKFCQALELAKKYNFKIVGVHSYLASNLLDLEAMKASNRFLAECALDFPDLKYINFGAGFGIPLKPGDKSFDWASYGSWLSCLMEDVSKRCGRRIELQIEPGRSIVGDAGMLLCRVTNIKKMDDWTEVGVDCGMGIFARPFLYGPESVGYHPVVKVNTPGELPRRIYSIFGNSVLQNDVLALDRELPILKEGDLLVFLSTGAYGRVMASGFPGRGMPKEIYLSKGKVIE